MDGHQIIKKGDTVYAHFLRAGFDPQGAHFVSDNQDEFQMGVMRREAGYKVQPHKHPLHPRETQGISEFLFFRSGKAAVTVYDEEWNVLAEVTLGAGDCLLFLRGGHELTMLEETSMVEVKQGPFQGVASTKIFRPSPS